MERKSFKFKLGLFIITAFLLFIALVIVLAGPQWRAKEFPAYTTLSESVQGLEVGSAVKFRGVPIGSVRNILIQENMQVRVNMELYEGSIRVEGRNIVEFLEEQIQRGYRCRVDLTGITGLKYIEIDKYDDETAKITQPTRKPKDPESLYIPSVRSLLAGVTTDLSFTLAKLAEVDFEKIGKDIGELVETANAYLKDERLGSLVENLSETGGQLAELSRTLNESDVGTTMDQVKQTLTNIDTMIKSLQAEVEDADLAALTQQATTTLKNYDRLPAEATAAVQEAKAGIAELRTFAEEARTILAETDLPSTARQTRRTLADLQAALTETAHRLNQTLTAMTRVAEMLEREPGALLRGKQAPPVEMGRD